VKGPVKLLVPALALVAGAAAAIPVAAGSEGTPSVGAFSYAGSNYWYPSAVAVAPGGSVKISNATGVAHGLLFVSGPVAPACSESIPYGSGRSGTSWSGTCTFPSAGVYTFYCTVHGAEMTEKVTAEAAGTTTTTTTTTGGTTTTTTTVTTPTGTGNGYVPGGTQGSTGGSTSPAASGAGGLAGARLLAAATLPGGRVRASLDVPAGAAGAALEAELLASRATLERGASARLVAIARARRTSLPAGHVTVTLRADRRARRTLARHRRLAVTLRVALELPGGSPGTLVLTRRALLRG
jgi:plastocyanin